MKILMILFTKRNEGTFYRAFPWATCLVSLGHEVTLLCTSGESRFRKTVSVECGVRIIETPSLFDGRLVMARLSGLHGWGPLDILARCREIRRGHYDIVHTFEHHMNVALPVYLAGRKSVPVLVSDWCDHYGKGGLRSYEYSPYRLRRVYRFIGAPFRTLTDFFEGDLRRRADAVTVISSWLRQRALSKGVLSDHIHLITGSAETVLIQPAPSRPARKKLGIDEDRHYALFFGAGQFDVDFSLEAFALVLQKFPDARFVVVGKKEAFVTRKVGELGIQDNVIQTGWITDVQLNDWLACADVCLLPMKDHVVNHARWPNKVGFYMAAGRPTVCTAINDVHELIATRKIGLISKMHPGDFAEQILHLFEHEQEAVELGLRARRIAEQEYEIAIQGSELETLYETLMKDPDEKLVRRVACRNPFCRKKAF